jgi:hypothetical protein
MPNIPRFSDFFKEISIFEFIKYTDTHKTIKKIKDF